MDEATQILLFVNEFCNQIAAVQKNYRNMVSYYVFDKRPGSAAENFDKDAADFKKYRAMFQP